MKNRELIELLRSVDLEAEVIVPESGRFRGNPSVIGIEWNPGEDISIIVGD